MILLTGFGGYGGRSANPAELVARALDGTTIEGGSVETVILPVDYAGVREMLPRLLVEKRPGIVVSLGLWPGEPMIRLERVALNWADFEIADNTGLKVEGVIDPEGPAARMATLPVKRICAALRGAGIPCRISQTAGVFLCNAVMFTVLESAARLDLQSRCGFIHLPYLPAQVAGMLNGVADEAVLELHQRSDLASMAREMMVDAVRMAIATTVKAAA